MKDAFGGIMNLAMIVVFLLIAIGTLALTVSYTKAFKMKNYVISTIEQYEGLNCFKSEGSSNCYSRIVEHAESIGYHPTVMSCTNKVGNYYCYEYKDSDDGNGYYYTITTQVDINFPIVNKIFSTSVFRVSGDTKVFSKTWYSSSDVIGG